MIEASAAVVSATNTLQVPTAPLYPGIVGFCLWRISLGLISSQRLLFQANAEAQNTLRLLDRVFDDSSDGIIVLSGEGQVVRHSASARAIFGADADGHPALPEPFLARVMDEALRPQAGLRSLDLRLRGEQRTLEYQITNSQVKLPSRTGRSFETGQVITLVVRDVTQLREQERDIAYLSNYDERTGGLRRGAFLAFLGLRLEDPRGAAVFVVSLERMKTINATLGRDIGDALLKAVVERLETSGLQLSAAARLGGTSFAVYAEGEVTSTSVTRMAERILDVLSRRYQLAEADAQIGIRLGYLFVDAGSGIDAATALERAEDALDMAKQQGTPIGRFDHAAWQAQKRAREIERALEPALANDEFQILYQPQHCLNTGRLVGAEALIRWQSPKLGTVYPDEFIGIAEATGFITELGKWTLERAARDTLRLPSDLIVAVNVSGIQIMRDGFATEVETILSRVGLSPGRICLELTETVLFSSTGRIVETMQDLGFLGLTWALDDFGTGFSSMEYLSKMPLDKIKLDKSFTMKLGEDPAARPILHATSELCQSLGVKLLCEGVETAQQLDVLISEGCAEGQGYYFGKPMPLDQLLAIARQKATGVR